jgi:hypothetical protein
MSEAIQYVRELADRIGPRPATTDAEAQAADYIEDVFRARGLDVERQEFDCPRTYSWAFVIYHLLTVASVAILFWSDVWGPLRWIAFAVAAAVAVTMWFDLDTRFGLSGLMPKGPSQNIIARRVPKARRGEKLRRIVIVAHYDSAKASLAFSPALAKNFAATFGLMKACTFLVPVLIFADNLPVTAALDPYLWYLTLAVAAYLLVPLLINVHRELAMRATDGANDNASGVAALLGIMESVVPGPDEGVSMPTQPLGRIAYDAPHSSAEEFDAEPARASAPAAALPDDFEWAEPPSSAQSGAQRQASLDFGMTVEFEPVDATRARGYDDEPRPDEAQIGFDDDEPAYSGQSASREDLFGKPAGHDERSRPNRDEAPARKGGLFGAFGKRRKDRSEDGVSGWLGVGKDFDARRAGKDIGHWENFEDDDEDFGSLGGWAGDDPIGDPEFATNAASRIRKRVTERVDHDIDDKEVWFVATGAEEAGTWGMRAFLDAYSDDLRGAFIINLDNIGTGALHWVTREGMARRYASDRRLVSLARKVSREDQIVIKGREYKGLSTDATPALARRLRAMSIMAFDINGRLPNWHWYTDTSDNVQPENIDAAVRLVTGMIREA